MECERGGGVKMCIDYYLTHKLITTIEAGEFYNSSPTETGPYKVLYMHLNFCYRCENPALDGKRWSVGVTLGVPELEDIPQ